MNFLKKIIGFGEKQSPDFEPSYQKFELPCKLFTVSKLESTKL